MSSSYSPGRSPASNRFQQLGFGGGVGGVSRLRSSSVKKPPEPLRRAVADCLSSSATAAPPTVLHPGSPSGVVFEASRTLRVSVVVNFVWISWFWFEFGERNCLFCFVFLIEITNNWAKMTVWFWLNLVSLINLLKN